jgi:hypothetical protein
MRADVDLDIGGKTFASGLLPELIAVLRRSRAGDLVAVLSDEEGVGSALETWCRFTGNPLLERFLGAEPPKSTGSCSPNSPESPSASTVSVEKRPPCRFAPRPGPARGRRSRGLSKRHIVKNALCPSRL